MGFKNVGSRAHGEFVPACGIDRTTHFEEKRIKEKVWRNVLNLETTVLPNAWGSKVGWMFYPKSDFLNYWETLLAVLVIYVAFMEPIRVGFSIETSAVKGGGLYWFEMAVDICSSRTCLCMRTASSKDSGRTFTSCRTSNRSATSTCGAGSSSTSSRCSRRLTFWRLPRR